MILIDDAEASLEFSNSTAYFLDLFLQDQFFHLTYQKNLFHKKMIDLDVMYFTSQNRNTKL